MDALQALASTTHLSFELVAMEAKRESSKTGALPSRRALWVTPLIKLDPQGAIP